MTTPRKNPHAVALGRKGGLAARGKSGRKRWPGARCPCGKYLVVRAKLRAHHCEAGV